MQSGSRFKTVNVVMTANLAQSVNLRAVLGVAGFRYDRSVYHCAYLKDRKTTGKVSIFATGKMISVGTTNPSAARHDLEYATRRLLKLGLIQPIVLEAKVQNIVAVMDLGRRADLGRIALSVPDLIYEPEEFPGAIWHSPDFRGATILLFANGKVVCTGLKELGLLSLVESALKSGVPLP